MPEALRGREVVLAGGSGGIGAAVAELLLAEGARVIVGYCANVEHANRWSGRAGGVKGDLAVYADQRIPMLVTACGPATDEAVASPMVREEAEIA